MLVKGITWVRNLFKGGSILQMIEDLFLMLRGIVQTPNLPSPSNACPGSSVKRMHLHLMNTEIDSATQDQSLISWWILIEHDLCSLSFYICCCSYLFFFFLIPLMLTCIFPAAFRVIIPWIFTYQLTFQKGTYKTDTGKGVKENQGQSNVDVFASVQHFGRVRSVLLCPLEPFACLSWDTELEHVKY